MNTTKSTPPPDRQPDDSNATAEAKPKRVELSATQIAGGALAAMTAAALGSRLGLGGTILGAAIASITAGVASALYTASIRHTREKVKTVFTGRIAGSDVPASIDLVPESTPVTPHAAPMPSGNAPSTRRPVKRRTTVSWKSMLAGALAAFAIAAVALTGFELISGNALSGGKGTTIEQVTRPDKAPTKAPSTKATKAGSPTPSESASETPTPAPAPTPTATETPIANEAQTPAAPESQTPSETPTPSDVAPSGAADSEG